jgi:hypothetical protein
VRRQVSRPGATEAHHNDTISRTNNDNRERRRNGARDTRKLTDWLGHTTPRTVLLTAAHGWKGKRPRETDRAQTAARLHFPTT